ncbi:uroporphyrinogen-III C-methyltransferase [Fluoribacter dumoffii]|uniref:Uroporphyrinogen-III C-methyltransferase n=1 Tax=Fluoribacter dumoffii TaxID=463 RepID=A0A377G5Y1_9GAMM|nr:uroporphyrinogen-III C-methyltransferase [Fluoribacter dumoffii]KTC92553.1 uroporphyrinogen III methylase HemX [Fluoribacter dumoffii NY 23]STO20215.1 Putative uroporphyrinogen-III C-methyltransferase [Fluoribacter dumoffii]
MTSDSEAQVKKTKKVPPATPVEKTPPQNNSAVTRNNYIVPLFAFIVALIALGVAAYAIALNQQLHNQLNKTQTELTTQLQQFAHKQDQTQEQINSKTSNTEEFQTHLQDKLEQLDKQVQNALNQKFYQNQDWLLLKARYYLELAQINAHWSNGVDSTIALLEQADQLLKQLNDSKVFTIRQAIAKDIAQMQALPPVDVAGLLSQLDAAQNSINNLGIPLPVNENRPSPESPTTSPNKSSWRTHIESSMNVLEKLVIIRRHSEEIKPLMSPLLEALLKEKLHLNIQEAQWAVLNNEPFVYQLVLKQAINSLKQNFNENTPNTAALIKKLTELQQMNIIQKRPTVGTALPLLNELIDKKGASTNQPLDNASSKTSEPGGNP